MSELANRALTMGEHNERCEGEQAMSAIVTTCPKCKAMYLMGVVGVTPWPAHQCPHPAGPKLRSDLSVDVRVVWK
jgi:hypothetical protein